MGVIFKMNALQKEIVLIPYPFSNLEEKKVRPAVIISNNSFNKNSRDYLLVPLTSVIKKEPYSIIIEQTDLSRGKLIKRSRIKSDKIFSIDKEKIVFKVGILNEKTFNKVKQEIYNII